MAGHDDLGGVDIPQLKLTNTTRLDSQLRGRARGGSLPIYFYLFLPEYMGWTVTDFARHSNGVGISLQPSFLRHFVATATVKGSISKLDG